MIQPYSDVNTLLKKDGIKSPNKDYVIKLSDTIYMIAFINDNELIQYIDLPKEHIVFMNYMGNPVKFNREDSKFNITEKRIILNSIYK